MSWPTLMRASSEKGLIFVLRAKYDEILNRFRNYYPDLYHQTIDWWPSGRFCITVKLEDGMIFEFVSVDNTIRRIRSDDYTKDVESLRKEIGHNLQKIIAARGIPQNEIAERSGVTQAMLSRYLHGTSMPGIDKVHSLASVLGCRVIDILGESYED